MPKSTKTSGARKANSTSFKKARKPHNVSPSAHYDNFEDLVMKVANEPRKLLKDGAVVEMSRAERTLRIQVERAMEGHARDVAQLIKMMSKHPNLASTGRRITQIFIRGTMARL